jgi:hypothetical protein
MNNFFSTILARITQNKNTTIGGGVFGVVAAALFVKLEEMTGCHLKEAFLGLDYGQLFVFGISQVFGALTTDANKTVNNRTVTPSN